MQAVDSYIITQDSKVAKNYILNSQIRKELFENIAGTNSKEVIQPIF